MVKTRLYNNFKKQLPRVDGKVFVITGTTSGTGFVAARTAAELGGEVVLLNRPSSRSVESLKKLKDAVPKGKFVTIECDLQDFASVSKAVKTIKSKYSMIYCLANNAGIMATPDKATIDGYDTQMQTNHLSHFLLTAELFPLIKAYAHKYGDARIVSHSSLGRLHTPNNGLEEMYFGRNGGNLGGDSLGMMSGGCFERYFQTKLANSVFTYGLHDKLTKSNAKDGTSNIRAICAHPGGSDTSLGDHLNFGRVTNAMMNVLTPLMMQTAEDGAMGLLMGMMHPDAKSGVLYGPKNSGTRGKAVPNPPKPYENDPKAIDMLWRTSEKATGVKFDIATSSKSSVKKSVNKSVKKSSMVDWSSEDPAAEEYAA